MGKIINFLEEKQRLEIRHLQETLRKKGDEPVVQPHNKEARIVSCLPWEPYSGDGADFRPLLQRDGLVLMTLAVWDNYQGEGRRYRANWIRSKGPHHRFAKWMRNPTEFAGAMPESRGDMYSHEGILGVPVNKDYRNCADVVYTAAPELNRLTIPVFVERLKKMGYGQNFDFDFRLATVRAYRIEQQIAEIMQSGKAAKA
jgi:hypothetical protein